MKLIALGLGLFLAQETDVYLKHLAAEAVRLAPRIETPAARELLRAVPLLSPVAPRTIHYRPGGGYLSAAYTTEERAALAAEERQGLRGVLVDTNRFYTTYYGSPLAALRALDLAAQHGIASYAGTRVLDFGFGSIGQLRLLALCGADAVGTEVMPLLRAMYAVPDAEGLMQGLDDRRGSVTLVFDRWPATPAVRARVGGGFDLFVSKNTLKRGYLHPKVEVDPKKRMDLGVSDAVFLDTLFESLKPGGLALIYNLGGEPAASDADYDPATDILCPWPRARLERHAFEILAHDADDSATAREYGHALKWNEGPGALNLENDLFARYTLLRRPASR